MIIVNQSKDAIINFDNLTQIYIIPNEVQTIYFTIRCETVGCLYENLGAYKTEERAKEVLQEIVQVCSEDEFYHIRKSQLNSLDELAEPKYILKPVNKPKVYKMPKE